jgi:osmotically inducible protein OsmC
MNRSAISTWTGTGADGTGTLSTDSGALTNTPFSSASRYEQHDKITGSNPEELLAAAYVGSFTMMLAERLAAAGHPAHSIRAEAQVNFIRASSSWRIPTVRLHCTAAVPGITGDQLFAIAHEVKQACPIAQALRPEVTMTASLA